MSNNNFARVTYKNVTGGETECQGDIESMNVATDELTLTNGKQHQHQRHQITLSPPTLKI